MDYILSLDQGTTSSRAIVFDRSGKIVGKAQQEFRQIYPKTGWVEHSPRDILSTQLAVMVESCVRAGISPAQLSAIGITNQRETTLVWDAKTGECIYNAIVWQCRRTADYCKKLQEEGLSDFIYERTGLVLDAYFSATKIKWILDNVEGARERAERGELRFGTVDTFLLWHLTKGKVFATDHTNASRTMLYNIHTLKWDDDLLKLFNIPASMLPEVQPSSHLFGYTDEQYTGRKVPICGVCGDQQAALFGHLCVRAGDVKNTYGTGCFLLMNTGYEAVRSRNGLVTTLAASLSRRPQYVLEGSVFIGGAVVQWLRDELKIIQSAEESETFARQAEGNGGVYIVPAFTGLGAPYWQPNARGAIVGLTRGVNRNHLIRASLESIAYQVCDLVGAMERDAGRDVTSLRVDGGASANDFLMQFQADILGCTVRRPSTVETTALGAAYLAGLSVGCWKDIEDIERYKRDSREFLPEMDEGERRGFLEGWKDAVTRTLL